MLMLTFTDCDNLEKVNLPSSITEIGNGAFLFSGTKTINYRGSKEQWKKIKIENGDLSSDIEINYNYKG